MNSTGNSGYRPFKDKAMIPNFRRWDKINKIMLEHKDIPVLLKNACDNEQFTYIQSTGLKDKKGVEIFDGDRLKLWLNTGRGVVIREGAVVWSEARFFVNYGNGDGEPLPIDCGDCEIIGTVHDTRDS